MAVDERIRVLFPRILSFAAISAAIGASYGYAASIVDAAGLRGLIRGALAGSLIGALAADDLRPVSTGNDVLIEGRMSLALTLLLSVGHAFEIGERMTALESLPAGRAAGDGVEPP